MGYRRLSVIMIATAVFAVSGCGSSATTSTTTTVKSTTTDVASTASSGASSKANRTTNSGNGTTGRGNGNSGSSKPLTRTEMIAKANVICKQLDNQIEAASAGNDKSSALAFSQVAIVEEAARLKLEKLIPPAELTRDWKQILTGTQTLAQDAAKYGEDAKLKNLRGTHNLAVSGAAVEEQLNITARRDGFKECALAL